MIKVVLDAMGGDNSPKEVIKGAAKALKESSEVSIILAGPKEVIESEEAYGECDKDRISILDAKEVISLDESPVMAIKKKKDSSIVKGMKLIKEGQADAFVSAGSSGAILAGGQLIVGRIKGVDRPPLATLIPTEKGVSLLIDAGANVDARPEWLLQFARMGSVYMEHVCKVKDPVVKLVNIGLEEEKGNALLKETLPLIKKLKNLNFGGYIEAREIPKGDSADVIVCDAFTGNVILKFYEGLGSTFLHIVKSGLMKDTRSKIGALLIKPALKEALKAFDASEYGGAPLLGCRGLVVKCHGNSTASEISTAILQCESFVKLGINDKISEMLEADKLCLDTDVRQEQKDEQ